jgi:hypothetical protein
MDLFEENELELPVAFSSRSPVHSSSLPVSELEGTSRLKLATAVPRLPPVKRISLQLTPTVLAVGDGGLVVVIPKTLTAAKVWHATFLPMLGTASGLLTSSHFDSFQIFNVKRGFLVSWTWCSSVVTIAALSRFTQLECDVGIGGCLRADKLASES